ncbi:hypothetical protein HYE67_006499 [Fusarium culmorum]|uniref:Uncharacterized protein n=1 Tax=Fusarium culmorum TaxID=5516 RepID=A0A2T4H1A7_FUSCU|nr:hypothetical protein FCULG_00007478 [Fusarium culmorum]QPC64268.1 hypothetical protein HYE67_006499 [Fusarium culmorum]
MSRPVSRKAREQSFSKMFDQTTLAALQPGSETNSGSSTSIRGSTIPSSVSTPFKPRMSRRTTADFQGNGSRSRPASIAPSRHSFIGDCDIQDLSMLAKYASRRATLLGWFDEPAEKAVLSGVSLTGVAIKSSEGHVFQPADVDSLLQSAVSKLDAEALISISSETLVKIIGAIPPTQRSLVSESTGARIPVVPNLEARVVLMWSQDPKAIIHVADHVQQELFEITQTSSEEDFDQPDRARSTFTQLSSDTAPVASPTAVRGGLDEKNEIFSRAVALEENEDENEDV